MYMRVDQPRHDQEAGAVDRLVGRAGLARLGDGGDVVAVDEHVARLVAPGGGVDNAAGGEEEAGHGWLADSRKRHARDKSRG